MNVIHYFNQPETKGCLPIYPISLGHHYHQRAIHRPMGYGEGYQWLVSTEGTGRFYYQDKSFELPEGYGLFIDKTMGHHYEPHDGAWKTSWMVFDGEKIEEVLAYMGLTFFTPYLVTQKGLGEEVFMALAALAGKHSAQTYMEASTVLYRFLYETGRSLIHRDTTLFQGYRKLQPVLEYLNESYAKDIPIEDLASMLQVTPQHFCVVFKEITGLRPTTYINHIRIRRAKELLHGTKLSMEIIANMCGYTSMSYFFTLFKKNVGMTPGAFRKLR